MFTKRFMNIFFIKSNISNNPLTKEDINILLQLLTKNPNIIKKIYFTPKQMI